MTYNQQAGEWLVDTKRAIILKAVRFHYDYSLCPETPSSTAASHEGADRGKLTLKAVFFLGKNGAEGAIPPHTFQYAAGDLPRNGLNPPYHEHDWDNWGSYRDPGPAAAERGKYKHLTPQDKARADKAAAWSLSEVYLPTGGKIRIGYESDD